MIDNVLAEGGGSTATDKSRRTGMTLAAGGINLDMFKGMDFDEVDDITETLADDQGFDSSATFKRSNNKEPTPT